MVEHGGACGSSHLTTGLWQVNSYWWQVNNNEIHDDDDDDDDEEEEEDKEIGHTQTVLPGELKGVDMHLIFVGKKCHHFCSDHSDGPDAACSFARYSATLVHHGTLSQCSVDSATDPEKHRPGIWKKDLGVPDWLYIYIYIYYKVIYSYSYITIYNYI